MTYEVQIAHSEKEFEAILELRYKILRAPWSQSKDSARDDQEHNAVNAYIISGSGEVIACGRLHKISEKKGQIRYMAVDADLQGKGLGAAILKFLESKALEMGFNRIELQARENAVEFYKSKGYRVEDKTFKLWDQIQHYLMAKTLLFP